MSYFTLDDLDDNLDENPAELYGIRDGILFVIDATPPMFEKDPTEEISYFLQCLKQYMEILKQKLLWNRQDWVGLILFGTEKWDMDPETKNILTLQKLSPVTVDKLQEILKIGEGKWEYYKKIASPTAYPLNDVLRHAAQAFASIKLTMPKRRVILCTCLDDPPATDKDEKHRIRVQTKSYNDLDLILSVVGLGEHWNHEKFYKDLEIASTKIDVDDYKRMSIKDLVEQVKLRSRNMAKLPWRIGNKVTLDVTICSLTVKTQYLKTSAISKETNLPLISNSYYKKVQSSNYEEEEDDDEPVLETEIEHFQQYGGRRIYLTLSEKQSLRAMKNPGIDVICVKPKMYHPMYHIKAPYFVSYSKSYRKDNSLLFAALLDKCESKDLMIICAVTIRNNFAPGLYSMIPSSKYGGFYLYKMPFRENVRDFNESLKKYIYDDNEHKPPTTQEEIDLMRKIIKKIRIMYDPQLFPNPKSLVQSQTIETLALDLEQRDPPEDCTLPQTETMRNLIQKFSDKYDELFNVEEEEEIATSSRKKFKRTDGTAIASYLNAESIRELVEQDRINSFTVAELKEILKKLSLPISGRKDDLIKKINAHYGK